MNPKGSCKKVKVRVFDYRGEMVADLWYTHTIASVVVSNTINLPGGVTGLDALALSPIGTVAQFHYSGSATPTPDPYDRPGCGTGPHLHQRGEFGSTLHRNTSFNDSGPTPNATGRFCSDTWVFKLTDVAPTTIETPRPCPTISAPSGLVAEEEDERLALTWSAPALPPSPGYTVTGYQVRHKAATSSAWPETWTSVSGTSHALTGLTNGTAYDVELRAVSDRFLRSAAIFASGTPMAPVGPTATPTPTSCTVNVNVQDSDGNALSVDGVSVTGGGAGACGNRDLSVVLTNVNYYFSSWTVASATGLTTDCSSASTTCGLTFGAGAGSARTADVTATFTRKWCTVTGNVQTLDTTGAVTTSVGGSVEANNRGSNSDTVPCGSDVTLRATAKVGYSFLRWSQVPCSGAGNPCTVTTSGTSGGPQIAPGVVYATAVFQERPPTGTPRCMVRGAHEPADGSRGTVSGGDTVDCGEPVTLTALPTTNNKVTSWSHCSGTATTCRVVTSGARPNVEVTATFGPKQCTQVVEADPPGGADNLSGNGPYDCGDDPPEVGQDRDACYTFTGWTYSTSGSVLTATANYTIKRYTLTVTAGVGGTARGGGTYDCGTRQPATATPHAGNQFGSWSGDSTATSSSISVYLDGPTSVHASFSCTLTVTAGVGGTARGGGSYDCGTTQSATATRSTGYHFTRWSGDSTSTSPSISVYLDGPKSVHASFAKDVYRVTVSAVQSR